MSDPPRQTEDPLSPPCVPHFEGDNGGSTYQGVSRDTINITFYNDLDVEGDMNAPWQPSDETDGHTRDYQQTYLVRTIKAQLRYFQARYQTYGRTVKVFAQPSQQRITTTCSQRQGDAATTMIGDAPRPFAAVHFGDGGHCYMAQLTKYKVPSFGLNSDVPRRVFTDNRPYVWGFFPDQEAEAAWSASFICRKLYQGGQGRARFAKGEVRDQPRRFGFIKPRNSSRGEQMEQMSDLLVKYLKRECGLEFWDTKSYDAEGANAGAQEAPGFIASFQKKKITTVVCYCVPVPTEQTVSAMQNAATNAGYYPEWYWDHASRMFRAIWNQTYSDQEHVSFGVSHHWRQPAFRQQYHYRAYLEKEPGSTPNTRFNFDIYHLFLNLFEAIQAAGPFLTPQSVETGMFTFSYQDQANPWIPTGGYGNYSRKAIATHTFVDTAMGWWWDKDGTPPGGVQGEGCLRVIRQGLRAYPGEWPKGDADLRYGQDGDPCTQDDTEIADPRSGDF